MPYINVKLAGSLNKTRYSPRCRSPSLFQTCLSRRNKHGLALHPLCRLSLGEDRHRQTLLIRHSE